MAPTTKGARAQSIDTRSVLDALSGLDISEVRRVLGVDAAIDAFPEEMAKVGDQLSETREELAELRGETSAAAAPASADEN